MEPFDSGEIKLDLHEHGTVTPGTNGTDHPPESELVAARRANVDAKQEQVARVLEAMGCEAALLLMPAHVSWFTAGMNVRGLIADSERPAVYTNGRQRWLICSNADSQRLFDEELDRLGFQLKEWAWEGGRADLLMSVTTGKKIAADRPFPGTQQVAERLRPLVRVLSESEMTDYRALGQLVAHAVEATARTVKVGATEEEIAGQLGHRLLHHGAEPAALSVTADERGARFRRTGFTSAAVRRTCLLQATAQRGGLFVTAGRAICLGELPEDFRKGYERSLRLAALFRSASVPGGTMKAARAEAPLVLAGTTHEFDGRLAPPGFGTGRFPAEELRRAGQDEPFVAGQPLVWQPRVGPAAVVDTVVVGAGGPECVTPPTAWPFKRVGIHGRSHDIPDVLVRSGG
jgi:Xaa-Pro aminopeptidase